MTPRGPRRLRAAAVLAVLLACLLVAAAQAPAVAAQPSGVGIGVLPVDGSASEELTLQLAGTYYLAVATDDAASYVNATLISTTYNGSLAAQVNGSLTASTFVSLIDGNYTLSLRGLGRAALGWDFTNGTTQDFPDNQTLAAYLNPSGPRLQVNVALGDARSLAVHVYDAALIAVGNATVNASGPVNFLLPSSRASFVYLVVTVTAGTPNGLFGLSWTSSPLNAPIDFTAWPWFLLWILVPVGIAFVAFVIVHRRRARRGLAP